MTTRGFGDYGEGAGARGPEPLMSGIQPLHAEHQLEQGSIANGECHVSLRGFDKRSGPALARGLHRHCQALEPGRHKLANRSDKPLK